MYKILSLLSPTPYILSGEEKEAIQKYILSCITKGKFSNETLFECVDDCHTGLSKQIKRLIIDECKAQARAEQAEWPPITDCDRLDTVENELMEKNIIFVQDIQTTPSSCWAEVTDEIEQRDKENDIVGAAFYHEQCTGGAIDYKKLYIYFGATDRGKELGYDDRQIKEIVNRTLIRQGLNVVLDSNPESAIVILPFNWQKRFPK